MKQAKRILALVLAVLMIASGAGFSVFAKTTSRDTWDYEGYRSGLYTNPSKYLDGVDKIKFTPEQAASYILDSLDETLSESMEEEKEIELIDEWYAEASLRLWFSSVDDAVFTIINLVKFLAGDDDYYGSMVTCKVIGMFSVRGVLQDVIDDAGPLGDISSEGLSTSIYRKADGKRGRTGTPSSDLRVLCMLFNWIANQTGWIPDLLDGTSEDELGSILKLIAKNVDIEGESLMTILKNPSDFLENLLYPMLVNEELDGMPEGKTIDDAIQDVITMALITGTGATPEEGGSSILGENAEPILPSIGAASLNDSFYDLVQKAIDALKNSVAFDALEGIILEAIDGEPTEAYPEGDPAALSDPMTAGIFGAITSLCAQSGASNVPNVGDYSTPKAAVDALLDWFLNQGGLDTFISLNGEIAITDSFIHLFKLLIRMLPSLLSGLGLGDAIEGLDEMGLSDLVPKVGGYTVYETDNSNEGALCVYNINENNEGAPALYNYFTVDGNGNLSVTDSDVEVNTVNKDAADYKNPALFLEKHVVSDAEVYGLIVRVLVSGFVDDLYMPSYVNSISGVAAYALASMISVYLPELNFFERLDAYYYNHHPEERLAKYPTMTDKYVSIVDGSEVEELPWSEMQTYTYKNVDTGKTDTKTVEVPRGAMDIGASLAAYYLNGVWEIKPCNFSIETTFEQFLFEFATWGVSTFATTFVGYRSDTENTFGKITVLDTTSNTDVKFKGGTIEGIWTSLINDAITAVYGTSGYITRTEKAGVTNQTYIEQAWKIIDATIFEIIPASWLPNDPNLNLASEGSWGLICDWLLNSIINLDLQKVFKIFQKNTNEDAEFNSSTLSVLINLIDRVLGVLFGGFSVLPSAGQTTSNLISGARFGYNTDGRLRLFAEHTTIDCFTSKKSTGLLNGNNLGIFVGQLLIYIGFFGPTLAINILPLLVSIDAIPETQKVGGLDYYDNTNYTISELVNYAETFDKAGNETRATDANGLTTRQLTNVKAAEAVKNVYGAVNLGEVPGYADLYYVKLPETFNTSIAADVAGEFYNNPVIRSEKVKNDDGTRSTKYYISEKADYITATATNAVVDAEDSAKTNFSGFHFAQFTSRSASNHGTASYEANDYRAFEKEDFAINASEYMYVYDRVNDAIDEANDFADSYEDFITDSLPDAYGDWMSYTIRAQLYNAGLLDTNDDGTADDAPKTPSSMYPFVSQTNSTFTLPIGLQDAYGNRNSVAIETSGVGATTYKVLYEALENGEEPVALSTVDSECVVRLALNSKDFDITPSENTTATITGWTGLSAGQRETIAAKCSELGLTFNYDGADTTITRPTFRLMSTVTSTSNDTNTSKFVAISGVATAPSTTAVTGSETDAQSASRQIRQSYIKFLEQIRKYNSAINEYYDYLGWRVERAESNRAISIDTSALEWLLEIVGDDVQGEIGRNKGYKRNADGGYVTVAGKRQQVQLFTTKTYTAFAKAYDYSTSLMAAVSGIISGSGITQSMITDAYRGLLKTWYALKEFGDGADWSNFTPTFENVERLIKEGNNLIEGLGGETTYEITPETWQTLVSEFERAKEMYEAPVGTEQYCDADSQDKVDDMQQRLQLALSKLQYNQEPQLALRDMEDRVTKDLVVKAVKNSVDPDKNFEYIIFMGSEGTQFLNDDYRNVAVRAEVNPTVATDNLGYNKGTGAKIKANRDNSDITAYEYKAVVMGDLSGDANITSGDFNMMAKCLASGSTSGLTLPQKIAADVNADTFNINEYPVESNLSFDWNDAQAIQDYIMLRSFELAADGVHRNDDPSYRLLNGLN